MFGYCLFWRKKLGKCDFSSFLFLSVWSKSKLQRVGFNFFLLSIRGEKGQASLLGFCLLTIKDENENENENEMQMNFIEFLNSKLVGLHMCVRSWLLAHALWIISIFFYSVPPILIF